MSLDANLNSVGTGARLRTSSHARLGRTMAARKPAPVKQNAALHMQPYAVDDSLWVMKVPRFLLEHMLSRGHETLGEVREVPMTEEEQKRPKPAGAPSSSTTFSFTLADEGRPESVPRDYEFRFSVPPPGMYLTSRGASDTSLVDEPRHEGRVASRGELKPREMGAAYRSLLKQRGQKASIPARVMGIIEDDKAVKHERQHLKQVREAERASLQRKREIKEANKSSKRARPELSISELKAEIIKLFRTKAYWSRQELIAQLGHAGIMNEALKECTEKDTSPGVHKGDFRILEKFRTNIPAASSSGAETIVRKHRF